jgi:hypothetical protein
MDTQATNQTPSLGDIRYRVYHPKGNDLWMGRLRLESISPRGLSFRYRSIDSEDIGLERYNHNKLPPATREEAVAEFQWQRVFLAASRITRSKCIQAAREIVDAEKLRECDADLLSEPEAMAL